MIQIEGLILEYVKHHPGASLKEIIRHVEPLANRSEVCSTSKLEKFIWRNDPIMHMRTDCFTVESCVNILTESKKFLYQPWHATNMESVPMLPSDEYTLTDLGDFMLSTHMYEQKHNHHIELRANIAIVISIISVSTAIYSVLAR